jgi:hypothetical protein
MRTIVGAVAVLATLAFAGPAFAVDADGDFIADEFDNCPFTHNPNQEDLDGDNTGDACDDTDSRDPDNDGYPNSGDNCPFLANNQEDMDGDGIGNACDPDSDFDGDGWFDTSDNCPDAYNPTQADFDSDGIGDECDTSDRDGDGVRDPFDNCLSTANPSQSDVDGDRIGDACDAPPPPPPAPSKQSDCTKNGWKAYGGAFKNQGQCVASVKPAPPPKAAATKR